MQKTNKAYNLQISEIYNTKKQTWWVEVITQTQRSCASHTVNIIVVSLANSIQLHHNTKEEKYGE